MSLIRSRLTIPASDTTSDELPLENGYVPVALSMPDAFTGTALTVQAKDKEGNWQDVYDDAGTQLSITVAANRWITLSPVGEFTGLVNIRFVSNSAEGAERKIDVVQRVV